MQIEAHVPDIIVGNMGFFKLLKNQWKNQKVTQNIQIQPETQCLCG
jgi:hypothetical protein